ARHPRKDGGGLAGEQAQRRAVTRGDRRRRRDAMRGQMREDLRLPRRADGVLLLVDAKKVGPGREIERVARVDRAGLDPAGGAELAKRIGRGQCMQLVVARSGEDRHAAMPLYSNPRGGSSRFSWTPRSRPWYAACRSADLRVHLMASKKTSKATNG